MFSKFHKFIYGNFIFFSIWCPTEEGFNSNLPSDTKYHLYNPVWTSLPLEIVIDHASRSSKKKELFQSQA